MPEAPSVPEVNILPPPENNKEREFKIALQNFMQESNNVAEYSLRNPIKTVTADYTIEGADFTILADGTSNSVDVTLPDAGKHKNEIFRIKAINIDNTVRIVSGNNIDSVGSITFSSVNDVRNVQSDGTTYWIISN